MLCIRHTAALFVTPLVLGTSVASAGLALTGVNLSGAEFGNTVPGTYDQHYTYPRQNEVDYYLSKGMNTFRLPFKWERLQRTLDSDFNTAEFNRLNTFVQQTTAKGGKVILDPHNYARYAGQVIGADGSGVSRANFDNLWTRLANQYKSNSNVIFGLMNEPFSMPSTDHWVASANSAIAAIRSTGANNLVLVPGNAWTGAHSWNSNWYGTPNATAMLNIVDTGNNYAFEAHQYLDADSSGTKETVVNANIGAQRLVNFTNWLKANNQRGFLGEFAVANSTIGTGSGQIGDEALHNMLGYIEDNADVWLGWTWWGAGPWWGNYPFSIEPTGLGTSTVTDAAVMSVVQNYVTAVPEPGAIALIAVGAIAMLRRKQAR